LVIPAVLTRLCQIPLAGPYVPVIAGVLTAAALDRDAHQWRQLLGQVPAAETAAWCCTAWLLADLADTVSGNRGGFTTRFADVVMRHIEDDDAAG
jgi:hypothetical protein